MIRGLWADLRYAGRTLRNSPVFTSIAVFSLALGLGANTAIFSLVDQILLRLLPVKEPQELALLTMRGMHYGSNWGGNAISYPMYQDFRDNNKVFTGMFCRFPYRMSLAFSGQTERVSGELVSGTYFQVLGVGAAIGRTFTAEEDHTLSGHPVAMLSYAYWKSRFAGDPGVLGKQIVLNNHSMTVVGVAQPGFDGVELGNITQVFVPVTMKKEMTPGWDGMKDRRWRWVNAFGRLKPGMTREAAQASLQPFFRGMLEMEVQEPAFRNASAHTREQFLKNVIEVLPGSQGRSYMRRQLQTPLWALLAATGFVLLIACGNVAGLLIARAASRQKEVAIRLALGAGRLRIIRQLLVESLTLSFLGALLGLPLAMWTNRLLLAMLPPETAQLNLVRDPDVRVLAFTIVVACLTGIIFGLIPAWQGTRPSLAPTLKDQAGTVAGAGSPVRLRKGLVTAQVTLSLLLLIGAGLFLRSLRNLRSLGPGFPVDRLIGFEVDPSLNGYDGERGKAFYRRLTEELSALPGVHSVGLASMRILMDNEWDSSVTVEGYNAKPGEGPQPYMNSISPGYFQALGVPILAGRDFNLQDTERVRYGPGEFDSSPKVAIINEKFAKMYFEGRDPIGRRVGFGSDPGTKTPIEIVGVIKDIKYTSLRDEIPVQMFVPYLAGRNAGSMTVYVRATLEPSQMFALARQKVRELDANLPVYGVRTMDQQISNSLLIERLIAGLSTVFGLLATVLAAIGLYGVMAYTVERRTREIGIRMALGALRRDVVWLVMREVVTLVGIGIVAGLGASWALTKYVQTQLYGVERHDALTMAAATLGLAIVACLAGYVPALRASRSDPMHALRYE
jgi:predicted permease